MKGALICVNILVYFLSFGDAVHQVVAPWNGDTVQALHREYPNIFRHGNRNAASHLWTTFLLDRADQMTQERLELMFSGFCAVSGSPVRPNDYNRYSLTLPLVNGAGSKRGAMHYCCWPCVCDTQDFIRIDTKTIKTLDGERQYHWAVLGNPCDHEEMLNEPFVQPFDARRTTLAREAAEVRCVDGNLQGATLSDHGYVIISMFFDLEEEEPGMPVVPTTDPQPGRISMVGGIPVQDEAEWAQMCSDRAANGFNSGMGEIFRKVAAISPIIITPPQRTETSNNSEL